jgi:4,5-DOPA dioxygenase extradiol
MLKTPSSERPPMAQFPALFISHGSPTILFDPTPSHHFLKSLGKQLEADLGMRPKAIVVATAHWETKEVSVSGVAKPDTIHDFFGFPQALFDAQYPAPGEPALAETVAESLRQAGIPVTVNAKRGLDPAGLDVSRGRHSGGSGFGAAA